MVKVTRRGTVAGLAWLSGVVLGGACVRANERTQVVQAALTAAPFVGPEVRVDEPVYTDKAGDQRYAFAAVGGPGAIVVWENDTRPGFAATSDLIWFVRLGPDGAPLDRLPIPITPASQSQTQQTTAAGWSGDRALAVWVEDGNQLRGARIGADGRVLDPNGIVIGLNAVAYQSKFRILPATDGWAVFWGTDKDTRVTRVSRDGAVATIGGKIVPMPAMTPALWFADAAPVTGGYLVMFYGGMVAGAVKVDAAGSALSTFTMTTTTATVVEGALGSNGTTAVALWTQTAITAGQPATPMAIMARRMSDAGAWLDAASSEVRPGGNRVQRLGVTWTGTNFICAWNDGATSPTRVTLAMRRMDPTGTFVDAQPIMPASLAGGLVAAAQVVWMNGAPLVILQKTIYTTENSGREDVPDGVETRSLDANLQPVGTAANPISVQANTQGPYRAASVGSAALTLWQDDRPRAQRYPDGYLNADVYGARLAIVGGHLTQTVMPVATANIESNPTIAWDGTAAPIAYDTFNGTNTSTRALAHLLPSGAPDGKPVTPASLKTPVAQAEMQLLPTGTGLIMAGLFYNSSSYSRPYVHRLSAAGVEIDAQPIAVSWAMPFTSFRTSDLSVTLLGGTTLLVWQDTYNPNGFDGDGTAVVGSYVTADGVSPADAGKVFGNGQSQAHPTLATDGSSAAVLWIDRGASSTRLMGARVDATLTRLAAGDVVVAEVAAPERLGPPAMAWTGTAYAAAWVRTSGGTLSFDACLLGADLQCQPGTQTSRPSTIPAVAKMLPTVLDAGAPGPTAEAILLPELVWTDAGGVLFYRRHDMDPLVDQDRLFARPVIVGETLPPEFDAGDTTMFDAAPDLGGGDAAAGGKGGATGGTGGGGTGGAAGAAGTGPGGAAGATGAGGAGAGGGGGGGKSGDGCSCETASRDVQASWYAVISVGILLARRRRPLTGVSHVRSASPFKRVRSALHDAIADAQS